LNKNEMSARRFPRPLRPHATPRASRRLELLRSTSLPSVLASHWQSTASHSLRGASASSDLRVGRSGSSMSNGPRTKISRRQQRKAQRVFGRFSARSVQHYCTFYIRCVDKPVSASICCRPDGGVRDKITMKGNERGWLKHRVRQFHANASVERRELKRRTHETGKEMEDSWFLTDEEID
jgi:hypothetical protein